MTETHGQLRFMLIRILVRIFMVFLTKQATVVVVLAVRVTALLSVSVSRSQRAMASLSAVFEDVAVDAVVAEIDRHRAMALVTGFQYLTPLFLTAPRWYGSRMWGHLLLRAISGCHHYATMWASRHSMVESSGHLISFWKLSHWSCWICCVQRPIATSLSGHSSRLSTSLSGKPGLMLTLQRWKYSLLCWSSWVLIVATPTVRTGQLTGCLACRASVLLCHVIVFLPFFVSSTSAITWLQYREVSLAMIGPSRSAPW